MKMVGNAISNSHRFPDVVSKTSGDVGRLGFRPGSEVRTFTEDSVSHGGLIHAYFRAILKSFAGHLSLPGHRNT